MKTRSFRYIFLLLFSLAPSALYADSGFFSPDNSMIPEGVRKTADSVFTLWYRDKKPYAVIPQEEYEKTLKEFGTANSSNMIYQELKDCQKSNNKDCPLHYYLRTCFLALDKKTIWSDGLGSSKQNLSEAPTIILTDRKDQILFDSRNPPDQARFLTLKPRVREKKDAPFKTAPGLLFDFSAIKLNRELPLAPLPLAKKLPAIGDSVFVAGYPTPTDNRNALEGSPDASGQLAVTTGQILSAEIAVRLFRIDIQEKYGAAVHLDESSFKDPRYLFMDADGAEGMNGAPILDRDGQVVGIYNGIPGYNYLSCFDDSSYCGLSWGVKAFHFLTGLKNGAR